MFQIFVKIRQEKKLKRMPLVTLCTVLYSIAFLIFLQKIIFCKRGK